MLLLNEKRMLRRIFGPQGNEVTDGWRKLYKEIFITGTLH
jgi:hypothetical protein